MSVIMDVESLANQLPGLIYANEHWRSGKYLYLIYPSHNGQRERKYVGADPAKIEAAKASIRRANEYGQLATEAAQIERTLLQGSERLRDAVAYLSGQRSW